MKKVMILLSTLALALALTQPLTAQHAAGADKDIVAVAMSSDNHTTLVAAIKAAGLVSALQGDGPFTVFAPTNQAFDKLPDGTLNTLLKPENKDQLTGILTYHVVPAKLMSGDVVQAIKAGDGSATVETLEGGKLTVTSQNGNVYLTDENGNKSKVTAVDLEASNGVIHVIDSVVLPK